MENGQIAYAGKYSAPDYETILAADCGLAIENTMIYHTPEVKEQLEKFGIPVLGERSSYETDPLARMEWVKLYGILLGKEEKPNSFHGRCSAFTAGTSRIHRQNAAFFSITSNNLAHRAQGRRLRGPDDRDGGRRVCFRRSDRQRQQPGHHQPFAGGFLRRAKDADVLIYNSTIEGEMHTTEELLVKMPPAGEFKAVQKAMSGVPRKAFSSKAWNCPI